jgi:hypothetical protein
LKKIKSAKTKFLWLKKEWNEGRRQWIIGFFTVREANTASKGNPIGRLCCRKTVSSYLGLPSSPFVILRHFGQIAGGFIPPRSVMLPMIIVIVMVISVMLPMIFFIVATPAMPVIFCHPDTSGQG